MSDATSDVAHWVRRGCSEARTSDKFRLQSSDGRRNIKPLLKQPSRGKLFAIVFYSIISEAHRAWQPDTLARPKGSYLSNMKVTYP
jgi:hypothetical protein